MSPDPRCAGFAVAGGRSARMGRDKALLPWGGTTLLDHALDRLGRVAAEVVLLCGEPDRYADRPERRVPDRSPGAGPLEAVRTGLESVDRPLGLFLAVDVPFVPLGVLRHLLALAAEADAVVPVSPGGPEPLCAVYARSCLEPIRTRLARGERRMTCFWPDVKVLEVPPAELARFGDPERMFRNLNSPEEYARFRERPPC